MTGSPRLSPAPHPGHSTACRGRGRQATWVGMVLLALPVAALPLVAQQASVTVTTSSAAAGAPEGWFGVDVQTVGTSTERGGRVLISADYPRVVSVEPGSPAAQAGLQAGDRLVAIAGVDLRQEALDLGPILRPGNRVPVSLERDGVRRDVTVVITRRPATFNPGTSMRVTTVEPAEPSPGGQVVTGRGARTGPPPGGAPPAPGRGPTAPAPAPALAVWPGAGSTAAPSPTSYLFSASPSVLAVAGAELMRPSRALQAALGVSRGVYVVTVAPRTPAERAGVQAGDVLLTADDEPLDEPVDFYRVLRGQADGVVRLELVRERRPLTLDLRW